MIYSMPGVIKMYGTHLKASAAMVRLRLYDVLSMLPPQSYEGIIHTQNNTFLKICIFRDLLLNKKVYVKGRV
jgi:hypothetical protein